MTTQVIYRMGETYWQNLGRNGFSHGHGIQVSKANDELHIEPINSRMDVTRCRVVVPLIELEQFIQALRSEDQ